MVGLIGRSIKGYELKERIGAGGFGVVYRAYQSTVGREVAIKIVLPGFTNHPDFIRRFEAEAQLVAQLEHLHIAPLYDYWRDPSGAYLVMRYLRGGSLRQALMQGPYALEDAALLLDQISAALSVAHGHGVVHRDIKPENILLDEDGNAYLADFGIAKEFGIRTTSATSEEALVGSPDYLAPEQARSEVVTPRTDIYSLGVVLYEMLAGEHPFPDLSPVERLFAHINNSIPAIKALDRDAAPAINEVVQKATAKKPNDRFDDARAMAHAFREAAGLGASRIARNLVELLTPREQEVLKLVVEGKSNREIAQILTVEVGTVKWYVNRIYKKLNVRSRVQAIVRARELDLIVDGRVSVGDVTGDISGLPEPTNPYKGLRPFQIADENQFYGREDLTRTIIDRLGERGGHSRFLAIVGPSGSGKSSLVRAGLIPALWRGGLSGSEKWFIADMVPGTHPLDELEIALLKVASEQPADFAEQLRRDRRGLLRAAQLILPEDDSQLLLVVDQFEELFTLAESEEIRTHLLELIIGAVEDSRSRVRVVITLRADFYDRPLQYPEFGDLVQHRLVTVLPLSAEELERAIARPAEDVGVHFEDGLVASIVEDVHYQPGGLPLMQYALTELFDARSNHTLTREAYEKVGGSTGALAKRADEVYQELDESGRAVARQVFLRLVTLGEGGDDTRRRVRRSELLAVGDDPDRIDELIDQYTASRLLSTDIDHATRSPTVELAHEAILREWPRLQDWLDDSREDIRLQRTLALAAAEWREIDRDPSFLLRGTRLGQLANWSERSSLALTAEEQEFLSASVQAAKEEELEREAQIQRELTAARTLRRRAVYLVGALAAMAALATAAVAFARSASSSAELAERNLQAAQAANTQVVAESSIRATAEAFALDEQAEAEVQAGIARSRELAAAAISVLDDNPELSVLLALESIAAAPPGRGASPSGVLALRQAMQANELLARFSANEGGPTWARLSGDGATVYLWTPVEGTVRAIDVATGSTLWSYAQRGGDASWEVSQIGLSPDGKLLAVSVFAGGDDAETDPAGGTPPPQVVVLRTVDGSVEAVLQPGACPWPEVKPDPFSPDGRWFLVYSGTENCYYDPAADWVAVYDTATWQEVQRLSIEDSHSERASFSPEADRVFLSAKNGPTELRTFPELELIQSYGAADMAGLSPDGERIVHFQPTDHAGGSQTVDFRPRVLDAATGQQLFYLDAADDFITGESLVFSPDGSKVLVMTRSHDYVFSMENGKLVADLGEAGRTYSGSFTSDGQRLLTGMIGSALLWDLGKSFSEVGTPIQLEDADAIWINPNLALDGPRVAVQMLSIHEEAMLQSSIAILNDVGSVIAEIFGEGVQLPDGRFALMLANPVGDDWQWGPAVIWDPETETITEITECTTLRSAMDFVTPHECAEGQMSFLTLLAPADGSYLAGESYFTSTIQHHVKVWDPQSLRVRSEFRITDAEIPFAAGSDWLVAWDEFNEDVLIREIASGAVIAELRPAKLLGIGALSPDESVLFVVDTGGGVWAYETATWQLRANWQAHEARLRGLAISPDGRRLVTTGQDSFVRVWDIEGIRDQVTIAGPPPLLDRLPAPFPSDAVWLDEDRLGVFLANDAKWMVVSLSVDELVASARARLTRTFTAGECATYQIEPCPSLEESTGAG